MNRRKFLYGVLGATTFVGAASKLNAAPLYLVPDETVLTLPNPAEPAEREAAELLQTWLRKAYRTENGFEIVTEAQAANLWDSPVIAVGKTRWAVDPRLARLNDDGYIIQQNGKLVSIAGRTADGAFYGAVGFLDRYAGVRFYMPGDLWTSLPETLPVVFDGIEVLSQPYVTCCDVTGIDAQRTPGADVWLRRVGGMRLKGGSHQHNLNVVYPPSKYAATHPEIYGIYNGVRYIPNGHDSQPWQVCFSQPATLAGAKDYIQGYFKQHPNDAYAAVSINDGGHWCECDLCQTVVNAFKAKDPQGNYKVEAASDIYWRFMNQLGTWMRNNNPGKTLVGLAYSATSEPPAFKLADNILVFAVLRIGNLSTDESTAQRKGQPAPLDRWLAVADRFGNHDWYYGDGYLMPRIYSGYWAKFMRQLASRLPEAYIHCEAYPTWNFDGLKYYIAAKLWWNPAADPKAINRQMCQDLFGSAGAAMANYFEELEALWTQLNDVDGPVRWQFQWDYQTTPGSREMISRCAEYLADAAEARCTPEQRQRIEFFSLPFAYCQCLFEMTAQPNPPPALRQKAFALATKLSKDKTTAWDPARPIVILNLLFPEKKAPAKPPARPANP